MSGRHRKPQTRTPGRHRRPPGPARFIAPGLVAVALLGAGGVGAHAALSNSGSGGQRLPRLVTPTGPLPSATSTPTPTPVAASPAPSPAVHRHAVLALRMVITGSVSWIEVKRPSGRVLVSGLVRHGHRLTYAHGPLSVVIGNAGAVQVTRHGRTSRAGRPGAVVTLRIPRG